MADTEFKKPDIIRTEDFVVKSTKKNTYGDLIVTSGEGKEYKVGNKRTQLFPVFQEGVSVHVSYSSFKNREYIADAVQSSQVVKAKEPAMAGKQETPKPATSQTRIDNSASIELQVAYKGIIELAVADRLKMDSQAVRTALNWAMSKLGYWASSIVEDKQMATETREKVEKALEEIDPLNWQVVKPQVEKLISSKKKGWGTTALILTTLKGLGATESKSVGAAYESLNDRGKQQFVDLVKAETPTRLIEEAMKIGAEEV